MKPARLPPELLQMYRDVPIGHPDMSELRDQLLAHIDAVERERRVAEAKLLRIAQLYNRWASVAGERATLLATVEAIGEALGEPF